MNLAGPEEKVHLPKTILILHDIDRVLILAMQEMDDPEICSSDTVLERGSSWGWMP